MTLQDCMLHNSLMQAILAALAKPELPCELHTVAMFAGFNDLQLPAGLFAHTPQLEVLVACRAGLSEFPAAVLEAPSLLQLRLASNSLSSVPADVTRLTK